MPPEADDMSLNWLVKTIIGALAVIILAGGTGWIATVQSQVSEAARDIGDLRVKQATSEATTAVRFDSIDRSLNKIEEGQAVLLNKIEDLQIKKR